MITMGKFTKGLWVGGLLGAGLTWLSATKKGRETREQILEHAAVIYDDIHKKITSSAAWEKLSENEYLTSVRDAVAEYAKKYALSDDAKRMVMKILGKQWKQMRRKRHV